MYRSSPVWGLFLREGVTVIRCLTLGHLAPFSLPGRLRIPQALLKCISLSKQECDALNKHTVGALFQDSFYILITLQIFLTVLLVSCCTLARLV